MYICIYIYMYIYTYKPPSWPSTACSSTTSPWRSVPHPRLKRAMFCTRVF